MNNPLTAAPARPHPTAPDHMTLHAHAWKHVNTIPPDQMPGKIATIDAILPVMGALAGNPNVKPKDVIKAAANAAADGHVAPDQAVAFISSMPADPEKLSGWLRTVYAGNLSAQVHMKAAMLQQAQGAGQGQPVPPQPMPQQGTPQ